jgi:hypothetical protein
VAQRFNTTDVLALQIQRDAETGEVFNLLENPDGALGGYGWVTPIAGSRLNGNTISTATGVSDGLYRLKYRTAPDVPNRFTSETAAAAPGEYVAARWTVQYLPAGKYHRARIQFLDNTDTVIAASAITDYARLGDFAIAPTVAPAGTVKTRLRFDVYNDDAGADPGAIFTSEFRQVALAKAATAAELGSPLPFVQPAPYVDILGSSNTIKIDREELNVGTLSATIRDADLDPATSVLIKPGRKIRAQVLLGEGFDPEPIFTGRVVTASVSYDLLARDATKRAQITISAADPIQALASAVRPDGVGTIDELPYVIEGAGVPWNVNGSGNQVAAATVVTYNDNATALDQIAITRDSVRGYAWVDRLGVLQAWDRALLTTDQADTLDETIYNAGAVVDYDLSNCINSVTIVVNRIDDNGDTKQKTLGPYVEDESVAAFGLQSATFTVQGISNADAATLAAEILAANAVPIRGITQVTVPIDDTEDLPRALRDLYDLVALNNTTAGITSTARIASVSHNITPTKWLMTLRFTDPTNTAPPTSTPEPGDGAVVTPLAPTGVVVDADVVFVGSQPSTTVTASWDPVTENSDGSELTNLDHYDVHTKLGAPASLNAWTPAAQTEPTDTDVTLTRYPVNQEISVRVRAVTRKGVVGDWSTPVSTAGATDTAAPSTPSAPVVTTRLGVIRVTWNGYSSTGTAMPADFAYLEVHASTTSGFTPVKGNPATLLDTLFSAGYALKTDGAYGTTWYFKFIAVDTSGNASPASAQASGATQALVNTDVIGQVIAGANIQDGTITASDKIVGNTITGGLIQALAITSGKIASNAITADKIEAGAITTIKLDADAVTTDKIAAGAVTATEISSGAVTAAKISGTAIDGMTITGATIKSSGAVQRVQFDSTGIKGYNSSGFAHLVLGTDGSMTATDVFAGSLSATDSGTSITTNGDIIVGGKLFVNGIATNSDAGVGSDVRILGTNSLVKITSSERYKENIRPAGLAVDAILGLEPCRYEDRTTGATGIGFIAERAHDAGLTEFVVYDDQGRPDSFSYPGFVVALQTVARQQHNEIAELKQQVADLAAAVAELRGQAT